MSAKFMVNCTLMKHLYFHT